MTSEMDQVFFNIEFLGISYEFWTPPPINLYMHVIKCITWIGYMAAARQAPLACNSRGARPPSLGAAFVFLAWLRYLLGPLIGPQRSAPGPS